MSRMELARWIGLLAVGIAVGTAVVFLDPHRELRRASRAARSELTQSSIEDLAEALASSGKYAESLRWFRVLAQEFPKTARFARRFVQVCEMNLDAATRGEAEREHAFEAGRHALMLCAMWREPGPVASTQAALDRLALAWHDDSFAEGDPVATLELDRDLTLWLPTNAELATRRDATLPRACEELKRRVRAGGDGTGDVTIAADAAGLLARVAPGEAVPHAERVELLERAILACQHADDLDAAARYALELLGIDPANAKALRYLAD